MSVPSEAWVIAGIVTVGWVLLLAVTCALLVRRAWQRADDERRAKIRANWRHHRAGILISLPLVSAGSTVGVFAMALVVASVTPQLTAGADVRTADVVKVVAAILAEVSLVVIAVSYAMKWQADRGYLLGNVAYPMGKDALDPKLNREAHERDLAVGRRQAARMWSLWPVLLAISVGCLVIVIVISIAE